MKIRTQISLTETEYHAAKREAERLGIHSPNCCVGRCEPSYPPNVSKPWMRYIGMVETGETRSSQNIDYLAYGQKD